VTVHLGPAGRTERVRRMLRTKVPITSWSGHRAQVVFLQSFSFEEELPFTTLHSVFDSSRLQEANMERTLHEHELMPKSEPPEMAWAFTDKQTEAQIFGKEPPTLINTRLRISGE
jgi:hypothetical protein